MAKKPRSYQGEGITVHFELGRCIHAAECVRGLPAVFDPGRRPWIEAERAEPEAIAEVVRRCPTGALTYTRTDAGAAEETPAANQLVPVPDGPVFARGSFSLFLPDGETREMTRLALCRCGASENKPFCDNRHVAARFRDDGRLGESRLAPLPDDPEGVEPAAPVRVRTVPDGPLLLEGRLELSTADDRGTGDPQVGRKGALCRCGASRNRPYCDGSHVTAGFRAE